MALQTGTQAPDAEVLWHPKEVVHLADYYSKKPTVLLFYPLAFSGVCTKEMCTVAEDFGAYEKLNAQVLGLSVDSPYVNQKFAESCNASFPFLSDFNKEATNAFDILRPDLGGLKGVSERAAFVIDTNGVIRYAWVGEHPGVFPPLDEIKAALESLVGS